MRENKKWIHMIYMVTQEHLADRFLDVFEEWWIRHLLKQYLSHANYLLWKEMLKLDPVGAKKVPKTNLN